MVRANGMVAERGEGLKNPNIASGNDGNCCGQFGDFEPS